MILFINSQKPFCVKYIYNKNKVEIPTQSIKEAIPSTRSPEDVCTNTGDNDCSKQNNNVGINDDMLSALASNFRHLF